MLVAIVAGGLYFLAVFMAGFVLGTLRTLVLAPHLGAVGAVALEVPAMLAIAWFACGEVIRRLEVSVALPMRLTMGGAAFALLMTAETLLAWVLFGRSPAEHAVRYANPDALLGLAAQIAFGLFPLARLRGSTAERSSTSS